MVFSYIDKKTDKATAQYKWAIALDIMKLGLENSNLRDEIFSQICKEIESTGDA